ncbi:hypothetical protein OF83DRAFT_1101931 [Amylostereum chailletii]|nr:hypothetical protein OF83DRAFT_1101931 [Amylostereum chailletii]
MDSRQGHVDLQQLRHNPSLLDLRLSSPRPQFSSPTFMTPPASPTPADAIQAHLYNSFLNGSTTDVTLHVSGSWHAIYKLHRVVLIQASFFQSLFTAGFVEDKSTSSHDPNQINLVFDDVNITRPAFEFCIARLYGGGPQLYLDSSIVPTSAQPLTASFFKSVSPKPLPSGQQPATPRFLMSLLAVSAYLSIPSLASFALPLILRSVGPFTVIPYLNFAIGHGIGPPQSSDTDAAVGLESVATILDHPLYWYYGAASNKIGQAATCWFARWGADMLVYELQAQKSSSATSSPIPSSPTSSPPSSSSFEKRRMTPISTSATSEKANPATPIPPVVPVIWRRGGLSAKWINALISSDTLFVKGEKERYEMAKTIVELRRSEGIDKEEESEWAKMFSDGIYYANMTVETLVSISQDVSPTTKRPYVNMSVVQAAHWSQSILRHQITSRPSSPPSSPGGSGTQNNELGIALTSDEIAQRLASQDLDSTRPHWPVRVDASDRIGDGSGIEGASLDELFKVTSEPDLRRGKHSCPSETTFFGLQTDRTPAFACARTNGNPGGTRWTPHPPFRFAVEFWDVDVLREKSRLHSHTIWYAGSLFNVYVQLVRRGVKGPQLGIYVHRQSSVDPLPPSSAPYGLPAPERAVSRARALSAANSLYTTSPTIQYSFSGLPILPASRATTPIPGSPTIPPPLTGGLPATIPPVMPPQPYRDPRSSVAAYFTVACPSATGASLTRFTSAPDVFAVSQSWGWKSSSLRTEEYLEVSTLEGGASGSGSGASIASAGGKEVSVRVTVVLGVV